jgi:hypothetical protein
MVDTIKSFNEDGFDSIGVVIGDDPRQAKFCEENGLEHHFYPNDPLSFKFQFAWMTCIHKQKDYICWLGSNNVHSKSYFDKCKKRLSKNKCATFGSNKFVVMSQDPQVNETCVFNTRGNYLVSSGQFFLTYTLENSIDILGMYDKSTRFDFDGKILREITNKWGWSVVELISSDPEDCIDVKNDENIHSYESYINRDQYPRWDSNLIVSSRYPRIQELMNGDYEPQ